MRDECILGSSLHGHTTPDCPSERTRHTAAPDSPRVPSATYSVRSRPASSPMIQRTTAGRGCLPGLGVLLATEKRSLTVHAGAESAVANAHFASAVIAGGLAGWHPLLREIKRRQTCHSDTQGGSMKRTQTRIACFWCRLMHATPMWPTHGQYECGTCGRHWACWGQPVLATQRAPLSSQPQVHGARRSIPHSIPQPSVGSN